jgi:hypothetical protein
VDTRRALEHSLPITTNEDDTMSHSPRLWAAAAILACAAPGAARAQSATDATTADGATATVAALPATDAQPAAGPTLASASVALRPAAERPIVIVRTTASEAAVPNALPQGRSTRTNATTLMIVGGAAFIAGAIIGDTAGTIIMVGGAGIGLYGLYQYLQ